MGEEFKNTFDSFIKDIIIKIQDKSILGEIQKKYDDLTEQYYKLTILTKEEFESIDNDITNYENLLKEKQQKIDDLNQEILTQKNGYENKINSLNEEMKKTETSENETKEIVIKYNELDNKYRCCMNDNIELSVKIKDDEKKYNQLQNDYKKIKKENFEKFELINDLQRETKLKDKTIEELSQKITKFSISNSDLEKKNKELTIETTSKKIYYENQIATLKKQIEQLSSSNYTFAKENGEVQTQLKDFQIYTNMVRAKITRLDEKDFSILEIMSQRAEKAEIDNQHLQIENNELNNEIKKLKNKLEPLENITLMTLKNEIGTSENFEKSKIENFSKEDIKEIEEIKNQPNKLLEMLIVIKNENLHLKSQIKDLSVECNQRLRDNSNKI